MRSRGISYAVAISRAEKFETVTICDAARALAR
jgi:hypothetical protein